MKSIRSAVEFFERYPDKKLAIKFIEFNCLNNDIVIVKCLRHKTNNAVKMRILKESASCGCPTCKSEEYSASAKRRLLKFGHPTKLDTAEVKNRIKQRFEGQIKYVCGDASNITLKHACGYEWETTLNNVLASKVGCPKCGRAQAATATTKTKESYLMQISVLTKGTIIPIDYISDITPVGHECTTCGTIRNVAPNRFIYGKKTCRVCFPKRNSSVFSLKAVNWLEGISKSKNIHIQHGSNASERSFFLNGKSYRVDGCCEATKTIYEFLGDTWHGNPSIHKPRSKPHPYSDKTANQLCKETFQRLALLAVSTKYKVVYVWEADFNLGKGKSGIIYP